MTRAESTWFEHDLSTVRINCKQCVNYAQRTFIQMRSFPLGPKKSLISIPCAYCLRPVLWHFKFFFAMKRCPIAAKIAGSIGTLPCCFKQIFHIGV